MAPLDRLPILFRLLRHDEGGQDLAEYGIALAVIGAASALIVVFVGFIVSGMWDEASMQIVNVVSGS